MAGQAPPPRPGPGRRGRGPLLPGDGAEIEENLGARLRMRIEEVHGALEQLPSGGDVPAGERPPTRGRQART